MSTGRNVPALPTISADLGGVTYEVTPLSIRAEREWKKTAEPIIDRLIGLMGGIPEPPIMLDEDGNQISGGWKNISVAAIVPMVLDLKSELLYATDTILELVYSYAPNIASDRERIEEEAYTVEVVEVFGQIVRLVFPLEKMRTAISGRSQTQTSSNSRALNGKSMKTN